MEGDRADVVGRALNYLPDSAMVTTAFMIDKNEVKQEMKLQNRSFTDTLRITAPALAPNSVEVQYSLRQQSGFADDERRYIPIKS